MLPDHVSNLSKSVRCFWAWEVMLPIPTWHIWILKYYDRNVMIEILWSKLNAKSFYSKNGNLEMRQNLSFQNILHYEVYTFASQFEIHPSCQWNCFRANQRRYPTQFSFQISLHHEPTTHMFHPYWYMSHLPGHSLLFMLPRTWKGTTRGFLESLENEFI